MLAIVGPTATGKSALALSVARHLGGLEIVSVDSMQVYRGMDIGTAKPSLADRAEVAHHLVDVAEPSEAFTVVRFQHEYDAASPSLVAQLCPANVAQGMAAECVRRPRHDGQPRHVAVVPSLAEAAGEGACHAFDDDEGSIARSCPLAECGSERTPKP